MRVSLEDISNWTIFIGLVLVIGGLMTFGAMAIWLKIEDARAMGDCRDRSGIIEHYDAKHESYWRCVNPAAERAP